MNNGLSNLWRFAGLLWAAFFGLASNCHIACSLTFAVQDGVAAPADSAGDEDWDKTSEIASSYFHAFLSNANAIRSGDCLLRICKNSDSVNSSEVFNSDGVLLQEVEWIRYRFDVDLGRFVYASSISRDRLDLGLTNPETGQQARKSSERLLLASSLNREGRCFFNVNGDFVRLPIRDEAEMLECFGNATVPDLRAEGWFGALHTSAKTVEENLSTLTSKKFKSTISESPGVLSVRTYFGPSADSRMYIVTDLDGKSLMPIKSRGFTKLQGSDQWLQFTGFVENVEWMEKSGIWLSTRVEHDEYGGLDPVLGSRGEGVLSVHTIVDLHWFSVNEKFEDAAFDGSLIDSERNVYRLLNPQLNNATTILERMKAEQPIVKPNPESDGSKQD